MKYTFKKNSLLVVSFIFLFLLTGCFGEVMDETTGDKDNIQKQEVNRIAINADDFKIKMEAKGYVVNETTDDFKQVHNNLKKSYIALSSIESGVTLQLHFYEMNDIDGGKVLFNYHKNLFVDSKLSETVEDSIVEGNYEKYSTEDSQKYKVDVRIDNTVVYTNSEVNNKALINEILDDLGY